MSGEVRVIERYEDLPHDLRERVVEELLKFKVKLPLVVEGDGVVARLDFNEVIKAVKENWRRIVEASGVYVQKDAIAIIESKSIFNAHSLKFILQCNFYVEIAVLRYSESAVILVDYRR